MNDFFKIEKYDTVTKFSNFSDFEIFLSNKRMPKKNRIFNVILPMEFMIFDREIDMEEITIEFRKKEK